MLFGEYLKGAGLLSDAVLAEMERTIEREIAEAFDYALASPNPTEEDLYKNVYAD